MIKGYQQFGKWVYNLNVILNLISIALRTILTGNPKQDKRKYQLGA